MKNHSIFLGISLLVSSLIIGSSIIYTSSPKKQATNDYGRYQVQISANGARGYIVDLKTKKIYYFSAGNMNNLSDVYDFSKK